MCITLIDFFYHFLTTTTKQDIYFTFYTCKYMYSNYCFEDRDTVSYMYHDIFGSNTQYYVSVVSHIPILGKCLQLAISFFLLLYLVHVVFYHDTVSYMYHDIFGSNTQYYVSVVSHIPILGKCLQLAISFFLLLYLVHVVFCVPCH